MELVIKLFLLATAIFFIVKGMSYYFRYKKLLTEGRLVPGKIIKIVSTVNNHQYALVQYLDEDSRLQSFKSTVYKGAFKKYVLDEEVQVRMLDYKNTTDKKIDNKFRMYYEPGGVVLTGIAILVGTYILHVMEII